jgi:hypothetical protein
MKEALIATVKGDEEAIIQSLKQIAPRLDFKTQDRGTIWIIVTYEGWLREHVPVAHWPGRRGNPGVLEYHDVEIEGKERV